MEIQERGRRARSHRCVACKHGVGGDLSGNFSGGTVRLVILTVDFELENIVCVVPCLDVGMSQEGDEAILQGAKSPLNIALGLGAGRD